MKKIILVFSFVAFCSSYSSAYTILRQLSWGSAPASWTIDYYAPNGVQAYAVAGVNRYCAQAVVSGYYSNGTSQTIGTNYRDVSASWPSTTGNPLVRFVISLTNPNSCSGPYNNDTMGRVIVN
jgi:hypothetical protein